MKRRGVSDLSRGLVEGTVVVMDLDRFEETVEERGWSRYRPNPATGLMTQLVELFVSKWHGYVVYGLDEERGTEEVVIEIPYVDPQDLIDDLEYIRRRLSELGVGITIVAVKGYVGAVSRSVDRRAAYRATPTRRLAAKLLRETKRAGGNRVVIA